MHLLRSIRRALAKCKTLFIAVDDAHGDSSTGTVPTGGRDPSVSKRRVRWEAVNAEEKRRTKLASSRATSLPFAVDDSVSLLS